MKKITRFAMMFLAGTLALGFTSCSDDDEENDGGYVAVEDTYMKEIAQAYLDNVVNPTYKSLADNAQALYEACQTLNTKGQNGTLTQADIDAACEAFKDARREWERSEAFLYGAASDNDIDPHIDSWPLDHDQLASALNDASIIAGIKGTNPAKFIYEKNGDFDSVLGFHGLEFVLFRNGANRTLAAINAGKETETGLTSVNTLDELAFAAAVSGDLRNMIFLLEYGWAGASIEAAHKTQLDAASWVYSDLRYKGLSPMGNSYSDYMMNATKSGGYFSTWQETLQNIFVGGCSNICQEVYTQKLGQAYRVATDQAGEEDAIDYIESPYSERSFIDYQDNIYSIKNSLYGTRDINATEPAAKSIMKALKDNNYEGYNTLNNALNEAIAALQSAIDSGTPFVKNPGHQQVGNCIEKINALDDALNETGTWVSRWISKTSE